MSEQFSNYPEIKWRATAAFQAIGRGDKVPINPDLENFKLVRFKDLRKQPIRNNQLMLVGSSKTNIFIEGPDLQLDAIVKRLPNYIGKSWIEINNMGLERDFLNCGNFEKPVCNPSLFDIIELKPVKPGEEPPELDIAKADAICAECEYFDPK